LRAAYISRSRYYTFIAIAMMTTIAMLAWFIVAEHRQGPIYNGKPLSAWLAGYNLSSMDPDEMAKADAAVRATGTNAIPTLLQMLEARDSALKFRIRELVSRQHIIEVSYAQPVELHFQAGKAFSILGTNAEAAVPQLMRMFEHEGDVDVRSGIANALAGIGPPAKAAVPVLLRGAIDSDSTLRCNSFFALSAIHSDPDLVMPMFLQAINDSDEGVRANAIAGLGKYGRAAAKGVPGLIKLLKDPDATVRALAAISLGEIGEDPDNVIPALVDCLAHSTQNDVRWSIVQAIADFGPKAHSAVPALLENLQDPDSDVRYNVVRALKIIEPEALKGKD
jgi:HEAT repeat protein